MACHDETACLRVAAGPRKGVPLEAAGMVPGKSQDDSVTIPGRSRDRPRAVSGVKAGTTAMGGGATFQKLQIV